METCWRGVVRIWIRIWGLGLGLGAVVGGSSACGAGIFECGSSTDCINADEQGICQPSGSCSFADPQCDSGQRYGARAPSGFADECVEVPTDGSTSVAGTDATSTTVSSVSAASLEGGVEATASTAADTGHGSDDGNSSTCGNGVVEAGEACDLGESNGPASECRLDCQLHECGDGVLGPAEQCDADNFNDQTCASFGLPFGALGCVDCVLDPQGCTDCPDGGCPTGCSSDDDCPAGDTCVMVRANDTNQCWPRCDSDTDCADCADMAEPSLCVIRSTFSACLAVCDQDLQCPAGLDCIMVDEVQQACL